jgi:hypothetical protein
MIHYQLRCSQEHDFDGWFASGDSFDKQAKRGLLECPICGDTKVLRALMAPSVAKKSRPAAPAPAATPAPSQQVAVAPERLPDHIRAQLQRMRAEVEKQCDYVGANFAAEARRIHTGESGARGIYGETTPEEAEALADDGIEVARIPWVPRADG